MKESDILQMARLEASRLGAIVWRNNQGAYKNEKGYYIRYGVCNPGGSDLIGIFRGRFLAIECKVLGKNPKPQQELFLEVVKKYGGIAGVVRNVEDVRELLK